MSRWFPERPVLWVRPQKAEPILATFERELDQRDLPRGTRLTCVVAGEGVRYRVVPWNEEFTSPAQRQVFSTHCFAEAYGDVARRWTVRQDSMRHGVATLACALDTALLDSLAALGQARELKLVSVQPALTHAFNQVRGGLVANMYWYVLIDGPWVTLLLMSAGEPLLVKSLASMGDDLARLLDREWFLLGHEAERCPVYVSRCASSPPAGAGAGARELSACGWHFVELPPLPDGTEPLSAQATTAQARTA
ncbi:MAG: hypothetical protein H7Y33_16285 [Cytophagales bacterium]|nr:hypothetical protein [Rhizobacter sp.]